MIFKFAANFFMIAGAAIMGGMLVTIFVLTNEHDSTFIWWIVFVCGLLFFLIGLSLAWIIEKAEDESRKAREQQTLQQNEPPPDAAEC